MVAKQTLFFSIACHFKGTEKKSDLNYVVRKTNNIIQILCNCDRSHLNEHTRMIHLKLKTICDLCGKRFSNINQHMRVVHKVRKNL